MPAPGAGTVGDAIGTGIAHTATGFPSHQQRKETQMPVTEIERNHLVNRLVTVIEEEATETLMKCILPDGRDQVATKDDLKALETTLRAEFAEFRAEATGYRAENQGEFAQIRGEIAQLRGYVDSVLARQMRLYVAILAGFMVTNWGMLIPILLRT